MPTVVLVDCSLSMTRRVAETTYKGLATSGLQFFFEKLAVQSRFEYTSLIAFSSLWEHVVPFTRDYSVLKDGLQSLDTFDKTCLLTALQGVESVVVEEWGTFIPVNIILVTDCRSGSGLGTLDEVFQDEEKCPLSLPFSFPCFLSVVCIGKANEGSEDLSLFRNLIERNSGQGELLIPDGLLTHQSVKNCFQQILISHYEPYEGELSCGNLRSHITLSPTPNFRTTIANVFDQYCPRKVDKLCNMALSRELSIIGFLDVADANSPPFVSRHLVIPISDPSIPKSDPASPLAEKEGKIPCFCVMLHGSLKIEKMLAIVSLGPDWFGSLSSWSDSKKKSSLVLSVYEPGVSFPWLGNLNLLGPALELTRNPYRFDEQENVEETPFPILPTKRRSYHTQPNVVWVKNSGLQSDIHKVLRYARKLPDKTSAFYKEINRIRRAAACYFFLSILSALADALDKEAKSSSPDVAKQLRHAAEGLRSAPKRDINKNILPL